MYQTAIEDASSVTCPSMWPECCYSPRGDSGCRTNAHPRLIRCVVCPSTELFVRKNFPQRLGIAIVVVGLAASCIAWGYRDLFWTFGILFSTALLDVILFFVVPDCLTCYRCGARYTGTDGMGEFGNFNLETHEKYRQQAARSRQSTLPS